MKKRILSFVLLLAMVMSFVFPVANATGDVSVEQNITNISGPLKPPAASLEPGERPVVTIPECDCGNASIPVINHADSCLLKKFYKAECDKAANGIFVQWTDFSQDGQDYILQYLSWTDREKLQDLTNLLNRDTTAEDSVTMEGTTVHVSGVPQNSTVVMNPVSDSAETAVESYRAKQGAGLKESLFMWDISVMDAAGNEWQPGGSEVAMELDVPGLNLSKYARVKILHVDDSGKTSTIDGYVTEDGNIAFNTNGFSTFAGFTVDFEYNGTPFSINGLTSVLLSDLFDALKMPLKVEDVSNVVYSTPSQIKVEKQADGDWLLTSLKAFTTTEKLSVTMNDGKVYDIKVTDAQTITYKVGSTSHTLDDGGMIRWRADDDGTLTEAQQVYKAPGGNYVRKTTWSASQKITITGSGSLTIVLDKWDEAVPTDGNVYVDLQQLEVDGRVDLTIMLSENFDTNGLGCVLRSSKAYTLFLVGGNNSSAGANLTLKGTTGGKNLIVEGKIDADHPNPIVRIAQKGQRFTADHVTFRKSDYGCISVLADEMKSLSLNYCTFENTIRQVAERGAVLYVEEYTDANSYLVDLHHLTIDHCTFSGNTATKKAGGAIALFGRTHVIDITNSTFTECKAEASNGGAIGIFSATGIANITDCTFTDCVAINGGAIFTESRIMTGRTNYTRMNELNITGCTFDGCQANAKQLTDVHEEKTHAQSHGGAICIRSQTNYFRVNGSEFKNCSSTENGGAISINWKNLGDVKAFMSTSAGDGQLCNASTPCDLGTGYAAVYDWGNKDANKGTVTTEYHSAVNHFIIDQGPKYNKDTQAYDTVRTTFTNCIAGSDCESDLTSVVGNGGAIEYSTGCHVVDAKIANTTINGCKAWRAGSAIIIGTSIVKTLAMDNAIVENCDFVKDANNAYYPDVASSAAGTIRTYGGSTAVLSMKDCTIQNNYSTFCGGGLYWNANHNRDGVECSTAMSGCTFYKNGAAESGGGIFVESTMIINDCNIHANEAKLGAGICQQVYSNKVRQMDDGEVTNLKLDHETWIHHNIASENGGGIAIIARKSVSIQSGYAFTVEFELNGAAIYENKAARNGGGIYYQAQSYADDADGTAQVVSYTKQITINASGINDSTDAAVYLNEAGLNGGGIYMESSENTYLRVEGGRVSSNKAANGGGIYMTGKNAICYIEGGTIGGTMLDSGIPMPNTATKLSDNSDGGHGGGIAIAGGAKIEMTGGEVSENKVLGSATNGNDVQGGGIWLADGTSADHNTMVISGGTVTNNSTPGGPGSNGGGIYVGQHGEFTIDNGSAATFTSGGQVQNNTCGTAWGGGIFANYYAIVNVKGGMISENTAGCGGGIAVTMSAKVYVTGGNILNNTATAADTNGGGGGIYVRETNSEITISGGNIQENKALIGNGGGINASYYSTVNIQSGTISGNEAPMGAGGGVYVNDSSATITNPDASTLAASINNNTASRGGGVAVISGGTLTITEGFVINNKALGMPDNRDTAWHLNNTLKGTGGGIYIADADSAGNPATFTLNGSTVGIYGNIADFAADDVFASGVSTKLNVPTVVDMNLDGYPLPATGWYEDYPIKDTQYAAGLNGGAGDNNVRYRGAMATERYEVEVINTDDLTANAANTYVCMTLGVPSPMPDTIVIDFGLSVNINVLQNEFGITQSEVSSVYVGPYRQNNDTVDSTKDLVADFTGEYKTTYGTVTVGSNKELIYKPNTTNMPGIDTFTYAVEYRENFFYATVRIIPATNIYYEDSFLTFHNSTGTSQTNPDYGKWEQVGTEASATQTQSRPGVDSGDIDANYIYGFDPAYNNYTMYSLGSAHKVTVDFDTGKKANAPMASFTFTGTGFDVISLTDSQSGCIRVSIWKDKNGNGVKDVVYGDAAANEELHSYIVSNYYGYTFDGEKWNLTEGASDSMYQVPSIKVDDLDYGTYNVDICAAFLQTMDVLNQKHYTVWVDAIRIYNPAKNDQDANSAYQQDKEWNPVYAPLKSMLLTQGNFTGGNTTITGAVFIDGKSENVTITDYENQGPNNELYLKGNNGIAFKLVSKTTQADGAPQSVHIGAKLAMGTSAVLKYNAAELATITTATNLYYKLDRITWTWDDAKGYWESNVIVLSCAAEGNSVLSLTDVKITANTTAVVNEDAALILDEALDQSAEPMILMVVDEETTAFGIEVLSGRYVPPVEPEEDEDSDSSDTDHDNGSDQTPGGNEGSNSQDPGNSDDDENVQTGDTGMMIYAAMLMALCLLAVLLLLKKNGNVCRK